QIVLTQEIQTRRRVRIVLMRGRFTRFGFDVKLPRKSDLFLVVDRHVQQRSEIVELALDVRIEQGRIALTTAPERVAITAEAMRHFERLLHLSPSISEHVSIRRSRRALTISL